jgi:N-formylglutamate deformylase
MTVPDGEPMRRADAPMEPFEVIAPTAVPVPVVVHVPHSATFIPADVRRELRLTDDALDDELRRMTDHHTDRMVRGTGALGATRFVNRWSRLVVDPERFDDPAVEEMEAVGMGAVYTATSDRRALRSLTREARDALLARCFHPYHAAFTDQVDRHLAEHGSCTILDVHSYPTEALAYERHGADPRPQLCVGTHPVHTPERLRTMVVDLASEHGFTSGLDTPFRGTFVPTRHLDDPRVRSVMLEFRRDTYLDERDAEPHAGLERVAQLCDEAVVAVAAW